MAEEIVHITVNGQKLEAKPDEMVLQTMLRYGIVVPHFCYHPKLSIAGVCRMCCVEVEGSRKLEISCSLPVREGMVVHTETPKVTEGQRSVMEFTLVNHPLDCPICDQAGECWLQEYYMGHDRVKSFMTEQKVEKKKVKAIGPRVMLDQERCILCTRCVRYCDEITHTSEIGIFNRGDRSILDIVEDRTLDNPYSENVVDICPVGALTSRDFRFDGRVWFLKESPSICPGCAKGCNTVIHHRDNIIRRILPRHNESVNGYWMCDAGRDVYKWVHSPERLLEPALKDEGGASWQTAFELLMERLTDVDGETIAAMASARATNEENDVFVRFMDVVFGKVFLSHEDLEPRIWEGLAPDELLRQKDLNPNTKGVQRIVQEAAVGNKNLKIVSRTQLLEKLESGSIKVLLVLQHDLLELNDKNLKKRLEKALARLDLLVLFTTHRNLTSPLAHVSLPILTYAEQEGSFINIDGILQNFKPALEPLGQAIPLARMLQGLADKMAKPLYETRRAPASSEQPNI